jgi:electron transfer flavoprotein beta subunit
MNILVCVKQILDPEVPARDFRIDCAKREAEQGTANLVTNIFCENALETALQFRERAGNTKIAAVSYGPPTAEDTLRKALAMKADTATLVINDGNSKPDPYTVAVVLAAAAKKLGGFDLILLGREAGDWGAGQTGGLLAEELGIPCVSFAETIEMAARKLSIRRQTDWGYEVFEAEPPLVLTITNHEHNVPRIPKVRDVMMSYRQPLTKWTIDDLGIDAAAVRDGNAYYEVIDLAIPEKETECEFIGGDTPEEQAEVFADRLAQIAGAV